MYRWVVKVYPYGLCGITMLGVTRSTPELYREGNGGFAMVDIVS